MAQQPLIAQIPGSTQSWVNDSGIPSNNFYSFITNLTKAASFNPSSPGLVVYDGTQALAVAIVPADSKVYVNNGSGTAGGNIEIGINDSELTISNTQITGAAIANGANVSGINTGDQIIAAGSGILVDVQGNTTTVTNLNAQVNLVAYTYFGGL